MHIHYLVDGPVQRGAAGLTSSLASIRYRVLLPAAELYTRGWKVRFEHTRASAAEIERQLSGSPGKADALCVSKCLHVPALPIVHAYARAGIPIVADFCDDHFDHAEYGPLQLAIAKAAQQIVASTPAMAARVREATGRDAVVIDDPFEGPAGTPKFAPNGRALNLLWFGHPSNLGTLEPMFKQLAQWIENDRSAKELQMQLTLITTVDQAASDFVANLQRSAAPQLTIKLTAWSPEATWRGLAASDAVLLPTLPLPKNAVKSANRLVESLRAGRLAIAHPMPAYQELADSAFIDTDLGAALSQALANPAAALERIIHGQTLVTAKFSPQQCSQRWQQVFESVTPAPAQAAVRAAGPLRLNLGCGDKILPDYTNVDIAPSRNGRKPDVICDLRALAPFATATVDEVLSVHVIEHFWRWEVNDILREWTRVLRPGGSMIIECPNLITACEELLSDPAGKAGAGKEGQRTMWVFYGDPAWRDPLMTHRWLYTPDSLGQLMREAGLVNVRREPAQFKLKDPRDMRMVGEKPAQ
jgi:glycosyltransferase involved in cell wall biosynthesis